MTLADDIARVRDRLVSSEWGCLQFPYARYLDVLPLDEGAVLVDAGAGKGEAAAAEPAGAGKGEAAAAEPAGDVGFFTRFVVEIARQALAKGLCVHVAEDVLGESAAHRALHEAGFATRVVWVRRRSRRYLRLLACAGLLAGDEEAFPFFLVKRPEQRLVCVPDAVRLRALDRHGVADAERLSCVQHVLLASDWIACPDEGFMQHLAAQTMIAQLYQGGYLLPTGFCGADAFAARLAARVCAKGACCDGDAGGVGKGNGDGADVDDSGADGVGGGDDAGGLLSVPGERLHAGGPLVVLYGDTLRRTGIETSLRNLLGSVDTSRARFVLLCSPHARRDGACEADYDGEAYLNTLPDGIAWLGFRKGRNLRVGELLAWMAHTRFRRCGSWVRRKLDAVFEREARRVLGGLSPDVLVHFTGYDFEFMQMMRSTRAGRKVAFVHNDMERELASAGNTDAWSLRCACEEFDAVCPVQELLAAPLRRVVGEFDEGKVFTVHNVCDADGIRASARRPLTRDDYEECSCSFAELEALLASEDGPLFAWLGRFVGQKGCDRLLEAFSTLVGSGAKARLVMAGSTGELYEQTRERAGRLGAGRIAVVRALANPYALLARADALVLSSRYEGMPMVVMEALVLGKPVICTDMPGVGAFLRGGGFGHVVENSMAGVEAGLADFAAGRLGPFKRFDADAFNARALAEFYAAVFGGVTGGRS